MLYLITEILVSLLVAAALGALVAWLAKDLVVRRDRRRLEEGWQRRLRDSEARVGTFKNQLAEAMATEGKLRAKLSRLEEAEAAPGSGDAAGGKTAAALEAEIASRDKKIELLKLQIKQSEASLTSEWQSLKALKTEVAERQRRLDTHGRERDAKWGSKLKASEDARHELERQLAALKQKLSAEHEALEAAAAQGGELGLLRGELARRDATIASLTTALERAQAAVPEEEDDLEQIRGIGPVLHGKLRQLGIRSFRQVASWSEDEVERVASQVGAFPGRIRRDRWIEKARELLRAKGGKTPRASRRRKKKPQS